MPLLIVRNDITKMECDAIVNAAKTSLLGGGGVDGAIHRAAGPGLLAECRTLGGCETGQAKITGAYELPCRYVIHTVGPVWRGGGDGEHGLLCSCYRNSLLLAAEHGCESVAFPLISTGAYGYPRAEAMNAAVSSISEFLLTHEMTVYIAVFDRESYDIGEDLFAEIQSYIDDRYVEEHMVVRRSYSAEAAPRQLTDKTKKPKRSILKTKLPADAQMSADAAPQSAGLEQALRMIDESFSEMLLRKIDERGMKDSVCYKRANVDRKLFSKIRGDKNYHPSKATAVAFAIALELSLEETRELLMKAGFALSHSSRFDIIVEYFITHGNYNIFEINEVLFAFDQSLLGS